MDGGSKHCGKVNRGLLIKSLVAVAGKAGCDPLMLKKERMNIFIDIGKTVGVLKER